VSLSQVARDSISQNKVHFPAGRDCRVALVGHSPRDVAAATPLRAVHQPQARAARDAGAWAAGAAAAVASTATQRVRPRGSQRAESDLAVGHEQGVGRTGSGMGVSGERDRLLHATNHRMESFAALPSALLVYSPVSLNSRVPEVLRDAVHWDAFSGNAGGAGNHPPPRRLSSPGRQQLHRTVPSQLEGGGSLGSRVPKHGGGADFHWSLDRGVQSSSATSGLEKSNASRGVPSLAGYPTLRGTRLFEFEGYITIV